MAAAASSSSPIRVSITSAHDGGNAEVVSATEPLVSPDGRTAKCSVSVRIRPDVHTELEKISHMQYFSFRSFVSGLRPNRSNVGGGGGGGENGEHSGDGIRLLTVEYIVENASEVSYPQAWPGTTVCYTTASLDPRDDDEWRRNLTTKYTDGKLTWTHVHDCNGHVFFSYWPPYTYDRHVRLVADCAARISARGDALREYDPAIESLGTTLEGRELECVSIGRGKLTAWIQHRQHPGETMAEFFAEGFLHRLLGIGADGELDNATKQVLEKFRLCVVPCMCPDGAVRGHLRTNAAGANLNREWATVREDYAAPTMERSPEVYAVLAKMDETGCDFFLDVHGDEELPYVFLSGAEKTPVWGERIRRLHGFFIACYQRANSDVQKEIGYPPPENEEEARKYMNVATNQVSCRFGCLGLTLEMPYKDCATNPDPNVGFGPARAKSLGGSLVEALVEVGPYLRAEGEFWGEFGPEDDYVEPTDDFQVGGFAMLKKRMYSDVRPHDA